MPALPPIAKVVRVAVVGDFSSGKPWVVTDHWTYTGSAPTGAQLDDTAGAMLTSLSTHAAPLMHDSRNVRSVTLTDLTSPSAATATHVATVAGTNGGSELPADVAAVRKCFVNRRYRGGHGRQYWPFGVSSHLQDPGHWTTTAFNAYDAAMTAVDTDVISAVNVWGAFGSFGQVSYFEGFTNVTFPSGRVHAVPSRRTTPLFDAHVARSFRAEVGTQRRRSQP